MIKFGVPLEHEKKAELSEKCQDDSAVAEYEGLIKKAAEANKKTGEAHARTDVT